MRLKPPVASTGYFFAMHCDMESQTSSLVSNERQLVVYLQLTSLSGEEYQVIVDLQEFDRFDEFETAVLEQLATIGGTSTFGCESLSLVQDRCSPARSHIRSDIRHLQVEAGITQLGKRPGNIALGFSWCTCPVHCSFPALSLGSSLLG